MLGRLSMQPNPIAARFSMVFTTFKSCSLKPAVPLDFRIAGKVDE
jgi:hypothetical protein